MMKKLAISIPTFNEVGFLKENLKTLVPQVKEFSNCVDLYVFDNNSSDDTTIEVKKYFSNKDNCFLIKNSSNIGLAQNQIKSLQLEEYDYQIIIGSDDILIPGAVKKILSLIDRSMYSIVYMNYYSFSNNYKTPIDFFAPEKNVIFDRSYDLLNYPSVGHFSSFIFKSEYVKKYLPYILESHDKSFFDQHRGVIAYLAAIICAKEKSKTFFYGERLLATNKYKEVNYNSLEHLCLDFLDFHFMLFEKGLTSQSDFDYRKMLVKNILLRSSIRNLPFLENSKNITIMKGLRFHFKKNCYFYFLIKPIFFAMRINLIKKITRYLINQYKLKGNKHG